MENLARKCEPYMESPNSLRPIKARQVQSMLIIFFVIKGTAHKEFVLAGQTLNSVYF
jgi:hypothetical protein